MHPVQSTITSPLGAITLAATSRGLTGVWFEGQKHYPHTSTWPTQAEHPVLQQAMQQLREYFAGKRTAFDVPLDWSTGTAFQHSVWQALLSIDHGRTLSYGELGQHLGKQAHQIRPIGQAIGRNPWSIVVPCHRVLGRDGSLTGYAGGLERKAALLQLEGVLLAAH